MSAVTSLASSNMENDKVPDKFPEGMKVLLVDDDLTCLTVVKRMLLNCKYDVTTCSEASMALSLLRENRGAFDLIISDVHMPDMDGFKLLELVGLEMDLPVIMMSGDTKFNVVMKGVSHGACDFLAKPVRMEELQNIWQHVVRRKWLDSKDVERSGSVEETEHNRQATDDSEYASTLNDGTDSSWKYQKKKRDAKEDDDGELESIDPSSSKKPRVVWSVELHQQFVNAVNQLGIDKAVPKRILELMSVPGLTRENVASHLQKFRLYLKRLSEVAQHQNGLNNTLCGASPNAKACQMGRLDYQALGISGQISPQTLAALQDELLGRPSRSLAMSATNQPIVQQASVQGNNCVNFERGITFGQPLLKGQTVPSFPVWSSNNFGAVGSGSNHLGVSAFPNSDMHMTMQPPQPQQQTLPSESNLAINVQPSCLVASRKSSGSFQVQRNSVLLNQESSVTPSRCSASYQAINAVVPVAQDSTSLKVVNHTYVSNPRSTMPPSQLLNGISVGNVPGIINEGSIVTSQPLNKSQPGTYSFLIDQNSMALPSQLSSTYQMQKNGGPINNHGPINNSSMINTGIAHVNFNSLSGQINAMPSGQMLDGIFDSSVMMGGYSVPVSNTSEVVSCSSNSTSWQLQSPEILTGHPNRSDCLVPPNTCNVQTTNSKLGKFHEKGYGNSLGFVGKRTCLPSRFAVDDNEPSTIELTNSGIYTGDDAYFLNQDIYGALQSGPCATTNFK